MDNKSDKLSRLKDKNHALLMLYRYMCKNRFLFSVYKVAFITRKDFIKNQQK